MVKLIWSSPDGIPQFGFKLLAISGTQHKIPDDVRTSALAEIVEVRNEASTYNDGLIAPVGNRLQSLGGVGVSVGS